MTNEQFMKKVENRANERIQKKIDSFRFAIHKAFEELTGDRYIDGNCDVRTANRRIMEEMIMNKTIDIKNFPPYLWRKEEEKVQKELFGQMDVMQRALVAKEPSPDDCKPLEE